MRGVLGVTPEHGFGKASARKRDRTVILSLFGKRPDRLAPVKTVFSRIVSASREPALFLDARVPDDFEGRFEMLALHVFLVLRRLRALPAPAADMAQDLVDATFAYLELGFRQGGVGDVSVPRKMKAIGRSFYGRLGAYEEAFAAEDPDALATALARNVSAEADSTALAAHARACDERLSGLDLAALLAADPLFPPFTSDRAR
jgi:cytochrome b pre-mRNA-processing protein 3